MMKKTSAWLPTLIVSAVLAACGGGGGDSPAAPGAPAAAPATPLKVSGVAATGAALANAAVTIQCAAGTASLTAGADGAYTYTFTDAKLPCVLSAAGNDSTGNPVTLHSLIPGSGAASTDAVANITPLTELLVAQLTGSDPASFAAAFGSGSSVSAADVAAAQTALLTALTAAGVDTTAVTDIVSGAITAGTGTGYDGVLDALQTTLTTAGVTLTDVTTAVATSSSAGTTTTTSTLTTALAPAASNCAGLKSGPVRLIDFATGTSQRLTVDATTLTASDGVNTVAMTENAACDYTLADGSATRVLVARSGLAVLLTGSGTTGTAGVAIPEQTLDVAALAGVYNRVQYGTTFDQTAGDFGTVTVDAAGVNTTSQNCTGGYNGTSALCSVDANPGGRFVVNADGSVDYQDVATGAVGAHGYAFRTPAGKTMIVAQSTADDTVVILTQQEALAAPAVGSSNAFWQFTFNPTAGLTLQPDDAVSITAVDSATGMLTRSFASDSHTDTLALNTPFDGTRYRAVNGCASSTGGSYNCNGVVQVPFGGLTFAMSSVITKHFITVSVQKP